MRVGDLIARIPNSIEGIVILFRALEKGWGRPLDLKEEGVYSLGNARIDFLGNYDRLALLVEHVVTFRHELVPQFLMLLHRISRNPALSPGGQHALGMAFSAILVRHPGLYTRTMAQLFRESPKTWFDTLVFLLRRNPKLIDLEGVLQVATEEILNHVVLP